jgi:alpha-D-ribose 1-methylphosphonate 5-triphosphate synthase subunit PhnG
MTKLAIIILLFSFFIGFQKSFAQSTPSAQIINVQYDLPYTGILPDNPLYFLKALRDNIYGMLITDPIKKSDYDLLMADKRLGGAQALFNKGEYDLAITTLSKSGNYFYQAIQYAAGAKKQGENINDVISRLTSASLKHQQIILQMIKQASKNNKGILGVSLNRVEGFQVSVQAIKPN